MATLTKRQKQIYDFIESYIDKKGFAPTFEEIKKHFKLSALSTVHQHIETLAEKGFLKKSDNLARGIELNNEQHMVLVPLLGTVAAGEPIEAIEDKESIAVPKNKLPKTGNVFALKVRGNSMVDENINDGDTILLKQQNTAENGQKVVALIDNEATLKKFYKEKNKIRLQPANRTLKPIYVNRNQNFNIQGILFDVIRNNSTTTPLEIHQEIKLKEQKPSAIKPYYEKSKFKLYQGDSLDILAKLSANSVDMIFADPPYNLSNDGFTVHAGKRVSVNKGNWDKSRGFKDDYEFHHKWLAACLRVLKQNGTLWVSGTYHSIYQCGHAMQALGYHILNDIAWFKPNAAPNLSCRFFTASHESLIWARKEKKAKHTFNYNLMKNGHWPEDSIKKPGLQMRSVWSIGTPKPNEKKFGKHPTQKPEELLNRIVLASTKKGDVIVDPFTGSSTTGIAAYRHGRNFIGIDTEKEFLDLSIKRFEDLDKNLDKKFI